jgi:hypothetical protein
MTDNTTLDAAIEAARETEWLPYGRTELEKQIRDYHRTYARALIAKLLEGMDGPESTEIRRRAGIEGGES